MHYIPTSAYLFMVAGALAAGTAWVIVYEIVHGIDRF